MLRNYLIVALRSLLRHKLHTSVNILGLGVGLASCALILLYVRHELSYDRFFPEVQRIYRVVDEVEIPARDVRARTALTPFPMARALEDELPEVERATRVSLWENARTLVGHDGRWFYEDRMLYADPGLLEVLAYPIRDGDSNTALDDPGSVVLAAATAQRHFGDEPAVGRMLTVSGEDRQVTAVLDELPAPSHMSFDLIVPFGDLSRNLGNDTESNWVNHSFVTYVRLRKDTPGEALGARLPAFVADRAKEQTEQMGARITPRLQPLTSIHLHSDLQYELGPNGDIHRVYAFAAVGVLVLLIACFNSVIVNRERNSRSSPARLSLPPASRSITHTTPTICAPRSRNDLADFLICPAVVTTSSMITSLRPATSPPSASLDVPYSLATLRTNSAGMAVICDSTVTIGMPPISSPARASTPDGISSLNAWAIARSNEGSDSKRYLSKYSSLTPPDRRRNRPLMCDTALIRRARLTRVFSVTCCFSLMFGQPRINRGRCTFPPDAGQRLSHQISSERAQPPIQTNRRPCWLRVTVTFPPET